MTFREELETLSINYNSPKLEHIKKILKLKASMGERTATFDSTLYDTHIISWLRSQALYVSETSDQREGDFIRVSW